MILLNIKIGEKKMQTKSGIRTTEFWATMLATILVAGGNELGLDLDVAAVSGIVLTVVTYIISRVIAKKKEVATGEVK